MHLFLKKSLLILDSLQKLWD